jgi:glycerophosphoryl diester phosphodiesterase
VTDNAWRYPYRPLAIAHRGHSTEVPENTLASYRRAIELGAEMIECDVNMTRDGRLVMIHDTTLDRTTSGTGPVRDATWDELERLDAGSWLDGTWAGLRIPSTEETIELARDAGILMCFEVKGGGQPESDRIARALVGLLAERDAIGFAFMSGYFHDALALAKRLVPDLLLAPERLPDDVEPDPAETIRQAKVLGAPLIQNHHRFMTRALVDELHANDLAVWSWPTTEEGPLVSSIEVGSDAVMGDDIGLMIEVLDRLRPREGGRDAGVGIPGDRVPVRREA